jgi:tetratricopeptide (TPR) repeat protein
MTDSTGPPPKRIGELLSEAGMLTAENLQKGLDYARKTALPLGRVLIMLRAVSEEDLKYALQSQSLIKFESLPNSMAVRALTAAKQNRITLDEALKQIGWKSDKYQVGQEPEEIKRLREQIAYAEQQHGPDSIEVGDLTLLLGDAYLDNELNGQAESCFSRAIAAFEKHLGTTHAKVAAAVWKLANLMFMQDRHEEASNQYWRVYEIKVALLGNAHPEVASALHDLAELHDLQNKYAEAERITYSALKFVKNIWNPMTSHFWKRCNALLTCPNECAAPAPNYRSASC